MNLPGKSSFLKNRSLTGKMVLLNFIGITAAMSFILVFMSLIYFYFARQTLASNLLVEARLLAVNTAPMLAFYDAEETLKLATTFKEVRNLKRVTIFDQRNQPFVDLMTTTESDQPQSHPQRLAEGIKEDIRYQGDSLTARVSILIEQEKLGTVVLESSLESIRKNIFLFFTIAAVATLLAILLSAVILRKLQMLALAPILEMSDLAERVARDRSYHLRAKVEGKDEIASLAVRFNQMLERIESWGRDLNEEIDQRRKSERHLDTLARTDHLTKLPNRRAITVDLDVLVESDGDMKETVLMFIDLDDFKQVNDLHGHKHGDTVLQVTAKRMLNTLRESDRLYRLGGDEFAVLLPNMEDSEHALQLAQRIISTVSEPICISVKLSEIHTRIGASIGIAFYPSHADSTAALMHRADLAMYAAKQDGKNSFRVFEKSMEK